MNSGPPSQEGAPPSSSSTVLSNETDDTLRFPDLIITPPKQSSAAQPGRSAPEPQVNPWRRTGVAAPLLFLTAAGVITSVAVAMILSSRQFMVLITPLLQRMFGQ